MAVRLLRLMTWVSSPRRAITSRSVPVARNLPSRMATASTIDRCSSCVAILPLYAMRSAVWLLMIFTRPLEVLLYGPDDDLVDVHLGRLLDCVSDRTSH